MVEVRLGVTHVQGLSGRSQMSADGFVRDVRQHAGTPWGHWGHTAASTKDGGLGEVRHSETQ